MAKHARQKPKGQLRRKHGTREARDVILIVCEGSETEPRYFRALRASKRLSNVHVEIAEGRGGDQNTVIEEVKKLRETNSDNYDHIWCVFDCESADRKSIFEQAIIEGRHQGFDLAVSNPCFEYWLLLHFEFSSAQFSSCKEVVKRLNKHIGKYDKAMDCSVFIEHLINAIQNANRIDSLNEFPNPSTNVHLLVRKVFKDLVS
jgi:hypothetical protein